MGRRFQVDLKDGSINMAVESGQILVVDDNRMNRMKLSISLEQQGHQVSLAEDGERALQMLKGGSYDVILLDIIMPGVDGFGVLEQVKSDPDLRDIPVIVISAVDEMGSAVRCIEMGAEDYLPKPFNPILLRARLNACLQKKKLRDLEKAYLHQEVMLRQTEKLATLGKLSAGMAHELNNPAAAALRAASQLQENFSHLQSNHFAIKKLMLTESQIESLLELERQAQVKAGHPLEIDPLTRSDLEEQIESWLDGKGVDNAWDIAPGLVSLGYDLKELSSITSDFETSQILAVLHLLDHTYNIYRLIEEINQGNTRISEIVQALKGYSYMDQAPIQNVDINAGLEDTLLILQNKLKGNITIKRNYAPNLPRIEAYGSELNQVWTNLIDNSIDAINGGGEIGLCTYSDDRWVIVEISDSGHGIPQDIQAKIFDPFFTTKPPGSGAGLGLNISHNIIVQKHKGRIDVSSKPGSTIFKVSIPLNSNLDPDT